MIRLSVALKLQALLAGAISTNQPDVTVSYRDKGLGGFAHFQSFEKTTAMNGVTAVDICEAPANLTTREVDHICVRNRDTASVAVTIRYVDGASNYLIVKVTLATLEQLFYSNVSGWYSVTAAGRMKQGIGTASIPWETPGTIGSGTPNSGAFTTLSASGQVTSTVSTGTAPLVIASTTKVANLNVDKLDDADWAAPAAIGSGTPAGGSFTTLAASSTVSGTGFSTYLASPPAIGGRAAGAGTFTTLTANTLIDNVAGQIKFPVTQVPSADANTLDDYEESTWTPTDGSGAGLSLTVVHATYTKVGRAVNLSLSVTYPATADGSAAIIGGLPFASASIATAAIVSGGAAHVIAYITTSSSSISIRAAAGGATVTNASLSGTTQSLSLTYFV